MRDQKYHQRFESGVARQCERGKEICLIHNLSFLEAVRKIGISFVVSDGAGNPVNVAQP
jgi:hypothetical protein